MFVETSRDHVLPARWNCFSALSGLRPNLGKPLRNDTPNLLGDIDTRKNRLTGEQFVKQDADPVNIIRRVRGRTVEQLRAQGIKPGGSPFVPASPRERILHDSADSKIRQQQASGRSDEDVLRCKVAVRELDPMRLLEGDTDLIEPRFQIFDLEVSLLRQNRRETPRLKCLHRHGRQFASFHQVIDPKNPGMNERPVAFDFVPQLIERHGIPRDRFREEMKRNLFSQHFILRDPDQVPGSDVQPTFEQITPGNLLPSGQVQRCAGEGGVGFGSHGCGMGKFATRWARTRKAKSR